MQDKNTFFRIPKQLFTDERFSALSPYAKLLYGVLIDRKSLSKKNNWTDENGLVYIYYTQKEAMEYLGVGRAKAIKVFAELDNAGLIHRKRQGMGKPLVIHVVEIESMLKMNTSSSVKNETSSSVKNETSSSVKNETSSSQKNEHQDVCKKDTNNTNINNTDINNTDINKTNIIYDKKDRMLETAVSAVKKNIEYDVLVKNYSKQKIDCIVDIISDTLTSTRDNITIACNDIPITRAKERLHQLNYSHIEYVLECLDKNTSNIKNIKSYLLTTLYNAPVTIDAYYTMQVKSDLCRYRNSA